MSIPQLKSFPLAFWGSQDKESWMWPLRPCLICLSRLCAPALMISGLHGFSVLWTFVCVVLCLESSAFVSPTHHPLPTNFYAFFRSQCKSASPEKSYQISLNRLCPSLYALLELDIFLLTFSRFIIIFPSPGDLPNPRIEPRSPTLQADSLPATNQGIVVL